MMRIRFCDLLPGDILYKEETRAAVFVVSVVVTCQHNDWCDVDVTFMTLFGCDWEGVQKIHYENGMCTKAGHSLIRQ